MFQTTHQVYFGAILPLNCRSTQWRKSPKAAPECPARQEVQAAFQVIVVHSLPIWVCLKIWFHHHFPCEDCNLTGGPHFQTNIFTTSRVVRIWFWIGCVPTKILRPFLYSLHPRLHQKTSAKSLSDPRVSCP